MHVRAYDKRTELIATAGYFVVLVIQLRLDLSFLELVDARVGVDVDFDFLRHGLRLPGECLMLCCVSACQKTAFHER